MSRSPTAPPALTGDGRWQTLMRPPYLARLVALSAGIGLHAFNEISLAPVLPLALMDLGAIEMLPWVYSVFFVSVIAGGLTGSLARRRFGARRVLTWASLLFLAGILAVAFAPGAVPLLLGRMAQGLADGLIVAICYSLIPELFPAALVVRVFATEAVVWAAAALLGPLAGGTAAEIWGWRAGTVVGLPLLALFALSAPAAVPDLGTARRAGLPAERHGAVIAACLAAALLFSLPSAMKGVAWAALALPAGLGLFVAIFHLDMRRPVPLFPPEAFSARTTVGRGMWVLFLMNCGHAMSIVFLAYAITEIWALPPSRVGAIVVTMALSWSGASVLIGSLGREGLRRRLVRVGPGLQMTGALALAAGLATATLPLVLLGQVLIGIGFGTVWGPTSQLIMETSPEAERGRTSALLPGIATSGYAIGAGIGGWIATMTGLEAALAGSGATLPILLLWGVTACLAATALGVAQTLRGADGRRI